MAEQEKTTHKIIFGDAREMQEIEEESVHLAVTSPPYPMIEMWDEDFKSQNKKVEELFEQFEKEESDDKKEQILTEIFEAHHQHLRPVWEELYRVLVKGGIACINIGDATRKMNGIFRVFTNHAKLIQIFENIGFVSLPYILWKKPTNRPNAFLGSGFLPTNGYVTLDAEYILIFRKGGPREFPPKDETRYQSKFTKKQRDKWFSQVWQVKGTSQVKKEVQRRTAAFPEKIPYRLIRMFSVQGDTVLDPFLGTGTTTKVAAENNRNSAGYEIEKEFRSVIKKRVDPKQQTLMDEKGEKEIKFIDRQH